MRGGGPFLVAADSFLCQQVRIGAGVACGPVFVVDIDHNMVRRRIAHQSVHPVRPMLVRELDETELDALQPPFLIDGENRGALALQRVLIHVNPHANAPFGTIADHLGHIDRCHHLSRIRIEVVRLPIPLPVVQDVVDAVARGEVDAGLGILRRKPRLAEDLAGTDPIRIDDLRCLVQVQVDVILLQQAAETVGSDNDTPRKGIRRDQVRPIVIQRDGQDIRPHQAEFSAREIHYAGLSDGGIQVIRQLEGQRTLALIGPARQGPLLEERLGPQMVPGLRPRREGELRVVRDDPVVSRIRMLRQGVPEGDSLVIRPELEVQAAVGAVLFREMQNQAAESIPHRAPLPERIVPARVAGHRFRTYQYEIVHPPVHLGQGALADGHLPHVVVHVQVEGRGQHDRAAVQGRGIGDPKAARFRGDLDPGGLPAVGRGNVKRLSLQGRAHEQRPDECPNPHLYSP